MIDRHFRHAYLLILPLLIGCDSSAPVDPATGSLQITFYSRKNGTDNDIFSMNPDGSGVALLVGGPGDDRDASWAPDGSRFAFSSTREGKEEIYSAKADGTDIVNLT